MAAKKGTKRASPAPQVPAYPIDPPDGATHFRLKRGGRMGEDCTWTSHGVEQHHHPLEWFTQKGVTERWGYSRHFWAQFSVKDGTTRKTIGGYRLVSLPDPKEIEAEQNPEPVTSIVPSPPGMSSSLLELDGPLRTLGLLKDMAAKDADARVASDRNAHAQNMAMTFKMLEFLAPKQDQGMGQLAGALTQMAQAQGQMAATLAQITERLEDLETDPGDDDDDDEPKKKPPEETDEERVERLVKAVRKGTPLMSAVQDYLGTETLVGIVRMLPKIRRKLPEAAAALGPMLKDMAAKAIEEATTKPAPPAPSPPPAPLPNGAPPAAAPKKAAPDPYAVKVE